MIKVRRIKRKEGEGEAEERVDRQRGRWERRGTANRTNTSKGRLEGKERKGLIRHSRCEHLVLPP